MSFLQGTADKTDIIGSTASASCLRHDYRCFIQIIFSGQQGVHDLSDDHERGIAGVIVYVFKPNIHGLFIVIWQYLQMIAGNVEG